MRASELNDFSPATALRVKTRIRRTIEKTRSSINLKHYEAEWVLAYIESLERRVRDGPPGSRRSDPGVYL